MLGYDELTTITPRCGRMSLSVGDMSPTLCIVMSVVHSVCIGADAITFKITSSTYKPVTAYWSGTSMKVNECIRCETFPCNDVRHECYIVPDVDVTPEHVSLMMISEAAPADSADYYYAKGTPLFQRTTLQAFKEAGVEVSSWQDVLDLGVYFTTAVKCGKTGYGLRTSTIKECALLLEKELTLFPTVKGILLMGSVAIRALNYIAKRKGEPRVIPPGSTYKLRHRAYHYCGTRVFPSYLQAGPSFFIEASKRRMIAEDIANALALVR